MKLAACMKVPVVEMNLRQSDSGLRKKKSASPLRWRLNVPSTAGGMQNAFLLHFGGIRVSGCSR